MERPPRGCKELLKEISAISVQMALIVNIDTRRKCEVKIPNGQEAKAGARDGGRNGAPETPGRSLRGAAAKHAVEIS